MDLLSLLIDCCTVQPDRDRSIEGEALIERGSRRFRQRLAMIVLLAAVVAAVIYGLRHVA